MSVTLACPEKCTCNKKIVRCKKKSFEALPVNIPKDTVHLSLRGKKNFEDTSKWDSEWSNTFRKFRLIKESTAIYPKEKFSAPKEIEEFKIR